MKQRNCKTWTIREVRYLQANYENMTWAEIGKVLKRSRESVSLKAIKLGLKRPVNTGQFQPGHKLSPRRAHSSSYKPGHVPANKHPEGHIWECQCGQRRIFRIVHQGKHMDYHRFLWEQHYGPVPAGYCLRFINGNSLDCRIENLRMISTRENLQLNALNCDRRKSVAARWAGKRDFVRAVLMCEI